MKKTLFVAKLLFLDYCNKLLSYWRKPTNKTTTIEILNKNIVYKYENQPIRIKPYLSPIENKSKLRLNVLSHNDNLQSDIINLEPDYVWQISRSRDFTNIQICASGNPLINKKLILNLDYGTVGALKELPIKFKQYNCEVAIAPWTHNFGGYYAFLLLILTKLCRIEAAFGRDIWHKTKVCYPLLHTSYEKQYLNKLGVSEDAVVDTRQLGVAIKPKTLILANNQTDINCISPHDIALLRQRFLNGCNEERDRKIFISRRGRRILNNETEIRELLIEYGFEIIEDTYRTVDEQIDLFNSASVIVAVHGAGLSNLVWCQPKTKVIELFYSGYNIPCFYYLATVLDLEYACLFDKSKDQDSFANQYCDLEIDPILLRNLIERVLIYCI
jgi:hypothetical protein